MSNAKRVGTSGRGGERGWVKPFLAALAETSNVSRAAKLAGVNASTVYDARRRNRAFAEKWQAALCEGYDNLEMDLLCRLREGELKPSPGAKRSTRSYDNAVALRLLMAHRALPLIFPGQAQRELSINEAHALADVLLHPAIEGTVDTPPGDPEPGECWLVGAMPTGAWADHAGELACFQAGTWLFATPRAGTTVFDLDAGQSIRFNGAWHRAEAVDAPTGGATVDTEARVAIAQLIAALIAGGLLADD